MSNNIIIPLTDTEIVQRARDILKLKNTCYRLKYPNGGKDPRTKHPAMSYASPELKRTILVCDCVGFAAWCSGFSRLQDGTEQFPKFPDTPTISGGYINTDSMIEEALGFERRKGQAPYKGGTWFKVLANPKPGCLVVFHKRNSLYPNNPLVGHVGVVSQVPAEAYDEKDRELYFKPNTRNHKYGIQVIDCSSVDKTGGTAVREGSGSKWAKKKSLFLEFNRDFLLGLKTS